MSARIRTSGSSETSGRILVALRGGCRSAEWLQAARRARVLSWLSLAWMGAEGAVAITAGVLAGSIALVGFGIDSAIEGFASVIIVWRFTGSRLLSHAAEERAQKLVAVQFFLLAPYVTAEAIHKLVTAEQAETSWLGVALTASSLVGMPFLGIAKRRLADKLGSVATRGEGTQNLLCAYLAGAVLVGLLGNTLFGLWRLDPAAALLIAAVAVQGRTGQLARRRLLRDLLDRAPAAGCGARSEDVHRRRAHCPCGDIANLGPCGEALEPGACG